MYKFLLFSVFLFVAEHGHTSPRVRLNYDQCYNLTYRMGTPSKRFSMAKSCFKLLKNRMSYYQCEKLAHAILDPLKPRPLRRYRNGPTKTVCLYGPCPTTTGWGEGSRKSLRLKRSLMKKCNKHFHNR